MLERLKGYVQNPVFLFILWMGVGLACSLSLMMKGVYSNYVIFSQSFWHAISSSPLYVEYLQEQKDFFLYGISFTALISPFAVLPGYQYPKPSLHDDGNAAVFPNEIGRAHV